MPNTQLIKKGYLFEMLSDSELDLINENVQEKEFIAGDYIFNEGSESHSMYLIKHGTVEILKNSSTSGEEHQVVELSAGALFGEMSFIDRSTRAASAMAKENTKLIEINFEQLDRIIAGNAAFGLKIYRTVASVICKRIRNTTTNLSSLKELKLKQV